MLLLSFAFVSAVVEVTVAVLLMTVSFATEGSMLTVSVKTALPTGNEAIELVTVPPAPTAGVVEVQPAGAENETKLVPAGSVSLKETFSAASGPLFVTVIV
jgi:hypothetical protein